MLPNDDYMLLSYINTKLRDIYNDFDSLCEDLDVNKTDIVNRLENIGYIYNLKLNKFIEK